MRVKSHGFEQVAPRTGDVGWISATLGRVPATFRCISAFCSRFLLCFVVFNLLWADVCLFWGAYSAILQRIFTLSEQIFPLFAVFQPPPPHVQPRPIAVRVYILHPPLCHIQPSSAGWGQDLGLGLGFGVRVGVFRLGSGVMVGFWGHDLRLGSGLGLDLRPGLGFGVLN